MKFSLGRVNDLSENSINRIRNRLSPVDSGGDVRDTEGEVLVLFFVMDCLFCNALVIADAGGVTLEPSPDRLDCTRAPWALVVPSALNVAYRQYPSGPLATRELPQVVQCRNSSP